MPPNSKQLVITRDVHFTRWALLVLYTLVLAGLLQAIFGSLMTLSGTAHGTFVNRNHYAN